MLSWSIFPLIFSITVTNVYAAPHCHKRSEAGGPEEDYRQPLVNLAEGNKAFRTNVNKTYLEDLTVNGQHPAFAYLGCSDSRVPETVVFGGEPGDYFTMRNIANVFQKADTSAEAFVGYAVTALGVKHIAVMGHYGCGGVAGAIVEGSKKLNAPKTSITVADAAVKAHIDPIVELYLSSDKEVHRDMHRNQSQSMFIHGFMTLKPGKSKIWNTPLAQMDTKSLC
ncbi:hypothetical protein FRC02_011872 [Tulasnella sp. 418]|nr:hypothetical protein FRC02_011872 [Tulasnella sp. 418]